MAQFDGSIVIETKLDTSGINNGAANMGSQMGKIADAADAAAQEIASSFSDIDVSGAADGMSESFSQESAEIEAILSNNEKSAKEKAESIAECYEEQGLSQSEAMKKAWEDIEENSKKSTDDVEKTTKSGSKKIKKHMDDIDDKSEGVGKNVANNLAGGISSAVKKIGSIVSAAFAVREIINFGKEAIELGSDLAEVQNVVDVTFTTLNEKVNEFAKSASATAGLSETMAKKYVGTFGAMSKSFGFTEEEALAMSTSLTQLSGDVASFYNLTNDEAYTKLKSVFTGETESLKDLGVVMSQTALDSYALAKGYKKTTKSMSEQEKVALRYQFVMDQLSGASGDFLRTSDGWANQVRVLKLNVESFMATIGQGLINLLSPAIKLLNSLFASLQKVAEGFKEWTEQFVKDKDSVSEEIKDAATGAEDMATEMEDAANETKKIKQNLSGLDEIKVFDSGDDSVEELEEVAGSIGDLSGTDLTFGVSGDGTAILDPKEIVRKLASEIEKIEWGNVGKKIGSAAAALFENAANFVDDIPWYKVGDAIGDAIKGIEWTKVFAAVGKITISLASAVLELSGGVLDSLITDPMHEFMMSEDAVKIFGASAIQYQKLMKEAEKRKEQEAILQGIKDGTYDVFDADKQKQNFFDMLSVDEKALFAFFNRQEEMAKQLQDVDYDLFKDLASQSGGLYDYLEANVGHLEAATFDLLNSVENGSLRDALKRIIENSNQAEALRFVEDLQLQRKKSGGGAAWQSRLESILSYFFENSIEDVNSAMNKGKTDGETYVESFSQAVTSAGEVIPQDFPVASEKMLAMGKANAAAFASGAKNELKILPVSAAQIGYDAGTKAGQNLSLGLDGQRGAVSASGKGLADSVLTDSVEVSLQGAMYQAGSNAGKQLAGALAGMVPLVKTSAADVMGGVSSGVETAANGNTVKNALARAMSAISSTIMTTFDNDMKNAGQKQAKEIGEKVGEAYAGGLGSTATSGIQSIVSNGLSKIGDTLKDLTNIEVGGVKPFSFATSLLSKFNVPLLAKGAVIPPNAPFAAILGDQKRGTNVEAPLDTIKQAVRDVLGEGVQTGGNTYNVTATAKGRALFDLIITEGHDELVRTGKNPFAFAKA